jgi:hypothetical protein
MFDRLQIVNQEDPLQVVLRSHLMLESALIKLIESVLPLPIEIELQQIPFSKRVDLAVALGVLPTDMRHRFTRINQIRNRFAHRFDSEINDEDVRVLWDSLDDLGRTALNQTSYLERDNLGKFGGIVLVTNARLVQLQSYLDIEPTDEA